TPPGPRRPPRQTTFPVGRRALGNSAQPKDEWQPATARPLEAHPLRQRRPTRPVRPPHWPSQTTVPVLLIDDKVLVSARRVATDGSPRAAAYHRTGRSPAPQHASRHTNKGLAVARPLFIPALSGNETSSEPVRHRLRPVPHAQLAEQPPGVRLHRVLGQVQLTADLPVALALAHAAQHLQLPFGQLDARVRRLPL